MPPLLMTTLFSLLLNLLLPQAGVGLPQHLSHVDKAAATSLERHVR